MGLLSSSSKKTYQTSSSEVNTTQNQASDSASVDALNISDVGIGAGSSFTIDNSNQDLPELVDRFTESTGGILDKAIQAISQSGTKNSELAKAALDQSGDLSLNAAGGMKSSDIIKYMLLAGLAGSLILILKKNKVI